MRFAALRWARGAGDSWAGAGGGAAHFRFLPLLRFDQRSGAEFKGNVARNEAKGRKGKASRRSVAAWGGARRSVLPAVERDDLDQVTTGVVQHGDGRAGHFGRRHGELGAERLHAVVLALHVIHIEHGGRLTLLEHRLLVGSRGGVIIGG